MTVEGTLDVFNLPEILQLIGQQRKTGILTVQGESNIVAISFLQGEVVAADALDRTVEDGLRDVLVREGVATAEQLAGEDGDGRPMDRWVEAGLVSRDQVLRGLRGQTFEVLQGLLGWTQGEFKFYSGDEVSYEEGIRPISIEELLVRSIQDDEPEAVPEYGGRYRRLDPLPVEIRDRVPGVAPPDEVPGVLFLVPDERLVLDSLAEARSVEQVVGDTDLDEYKVRLALYRLLEREVVAPFDAQRDEEVEQLFDVPVLADIEPPPDLGVDDEDESLLGDLPLTEEAPAQAQTPEPAAEEPVVEEARPAEPESDDSLPEIDLDLTLQGQASAPVPAPALRRRVRFRGLEGWVGRGLGLLLALLFVSQLVPGPLRLLSPFPWQEAEREALVKGRLGASFLKIDRALKTLFLLDGSFPPNLNRPIEAKLLEEPDLDSGDGRRVLWQTTEGGYDLTLDSAGGGPTASETVIENFFLDPAFVGLDDEGATAPLVLLD
ncbi:MAG: DUF4388 domain-containing protein [Acidobacteriota bacterium]